MLYHRVSRLFTALALAPGDGRYAKLMTTLGRAKLLILDDWGPETLSAEQARDLLEIIEDRMDAGSILVTSQVPVDRWHDMIGLPTIADAILDRLVHNAYRIELKEESLRSNAKAIAAERDRHQIGTPAGFGSEQVAGFLSECMAGFIGIRR